MARPEKIHLRRSDAEQIENLIDVGAPGRDAATLDLLNDELSRAVIVDDDALPEGTVALGSRVSFRDDDTGEEREITLVVPSQTSPSEGRFSILSPVGAALIGLAVGDHIDWPLPGGKVRRLRVLKVQQ